MKVSIDKMMNSKGYTTRRILGLSALTLSLAACNAIPPADRSPVVAMPNIPLNNGYDGQPSSTEHNRSMAAERWQDYYQDPKLQSLIAIGLENNKDIEQTLLAIRRARAQYQVTDNSDLPQLNGSGSYSRGANNAADANPSDSYSANLGLANYELDFWGRIASLKEQALQNFLATTAARDTAKVSLIANIAQSYVSLSYQMMQLELASKTLESRIESLRITQARLQAGIDPKTPSLQAAVAADDAYIAKLEAERSVKKGINALEYLIGAPVPEALLPTPAVNSITDKKVFTPGLPSELLRYRPDILQAEYELKAAGANIDAARAAYYPSISLTGRLGYSSSDLDDLFKSSAAGWSFGPSISVPIFDAGQLDANYEVAQIEQEQALLSYERAIETAFKEVIDVLTDKAALDARLAAEYRLQKNYQQIVEIAEARYQAQVDDYLSVLDAQRSQFATQQRIVSLEQERVMNQIQMYKVLGGGANLAEPITIPVPQHRNLVNLLDSTTQDEKAMTAIQAASSPEIVTSRQADIIQASKPTTLIKSKIIDTVDVNNDSNPDAIVAEVTKTTQPSMLEQPMIRQPIVTQPVVTQPVAEQPVVEQPVNKAPMTDSTNSPVTNPVPSSNPSVTKPITEQSIVEPLASKEVVTVQPATTDSSAIDLSTSDSSANVDAGDSITNAQLSQQPTVETSMIKTPIDTQSAEMLPSNEQSAKASLIESSLSTPNVESDTQVDTISNTAHDTVNNISQKMNSETVTSVQMIDSTTPGTDTTSVPQEPVDKPAVK